MDGTLLIDGTTDTVGCMEGVAEGYLLGRPLGQLDMVGDTEIEGLIVAVSLNKTHTSASN